MRPLNLTIDAIMNVVRGQDIPNKTEFLTELRTIESKCNVEDLNRNSALWFELSGILSKYLGEQDQPWKEKIADLYQGREDFTKYL